MAIMKTLTPAPETEQSEELRLNLDGNIEALDYSVNPKRDPTKGPEKHHQCGESFSRLGAVVADDLRDELYAPENCANCAEDGGGKWYCCLRRHLCSES